MHNNIFEQLQRAAENFWYFSVALDESNDLVDTAQLLIFICGIDDEFNVTEDLATLESTCMTEL